MPAPTKRSRTIGIAATVSPNSAELEARTRMINCQRISDRYERLDDESFTCIVTLPKKKKSNFRRQIMI